jgi:beta-1,4-mannosyltransferase
MKALFLYGLKENDNPYVRLLVEALEGSDAEVRFGRSGRLYLWQSVKSSGRPDVVHLQWQHKYFTGKSTLDAMRRSLQFFIQLLGLRLVGVPFVWTVHNIVNHEKKQGRWELLMCRLLARSVNALIVHCDSAVPVVAAAYSVHPRRIRVIPHGNYIGSYPVPRGRVAARAKHDFDKEARIFLFFGQVRGYKGVNELLEAFEALPSPGVRLVVAGQLKAGDSEGQVLERVERDPRVTAMFGFIPDEDLIDYICACDVVVLPYRQSLTSGAAILAASYGRPILAPRIGCMQEFPPEAAILFDPDDPDGLGNALQHAMSASLDDMGEAARAYIQQFPWSLVGARTADLYREISSQKPG